MKKSEVWSQREQATIAALWQTLNTRGHHAERVQDTQADTRGDTRLQTIRPHVTRRKNG